VKSSDEQNRDFRTGHVTMLLLRHLLATAAVFALAISPTSATVTNASDVFNVRFVPLSLQFPSC
jgi:hypothetical protein